MSKKLEQSDLERLAWAARQIRDFSESGNYGRLVIHFDAGRITRTEEVKNNRPPE